MTNILFIFLTKSIIMVEIKSIVVPPKKNAISFSRIFCRIIGKEHRQIKYKAPISIIL